MTQELLMWETYSVKVTAFVQRVSTANIRELSYFGDLVGEKRKTRQDFHGSLITATAAVRPVDLILLVLGFMSIRFGGRRCLFL